MTRAKEPILVVDDEKPILDSINRSLRKYPLEVVTAQSAGRAMELIEGGRFFPKLVISDQRMPEMSGVEFLSWMKENYPEVVRVLLTGYADLESAKQAINQGAIYKYLEKPWQEKELVGTIKDGVNLYNLLKRTQERMVKLEENLAKKEKEIGKLKQEIKSFRTLERTLEEEIKSLLDEVFKLSRYAKAEAMLSDLEFFINNQLAGALLNVDLVLQSYARDAFLFETMNSLKAKLECTQRRVEDLVYFLRSSSRQNTPSFNQTVENIIYYLMTVSRKPGINYELKLTKNDRPLPIAEDKLITIIFELIFWLLSQMEENGKIVVETRFKPSSQKMVFSLFTPNLRSGPSTSILNSTLVREFKKTTGGELKLKRNDTGFELRLVIPAGLYLHSDRVLKI